MMNILISESDLLFQCGLQYFLAELFCDGLNQDIHFSFELTHENVRAADIIVISLCPGETLTCFPELQSRKKGILVGVVDDISRAFASPSCFQDVIFVSRRASLLEFSETLYVAWEKIRHPGYKWSKNSCFDCQHKKLSGQQLRIVSGLYKGLSFMQIASELNISDKAVFSHKYMLMQKFNLRSDFELMALLRRLAEKKNYPNILRDCLD